MPREVKSVLCRFAAVVMCLCPGAETGSRASSLLRVEGLLGVGAGLLANGGKRNHVLRQKRAWRIKTVPSGSEYALELRPLLGR